VLEARLVDERAFVVELGRVDVLIHSQTVRTLVLFRPARTLQRTLALLLHWIFTARTVTHAALSLSLSLKLATYDPA